MGNQNSPPLLRDLQLWMKWVVTDPRGVSEALSDPFPTNRVNIERYTSPKKEALSWIAEAPPLNKTERLDIYAEAYFLRIFDSMKDDFRATASLLDENSFRKLVADYLKVHPSKTSNIGEIGKGFAEFISTYEDLKEFLPLASLAKAEWFAIESFYAEDSGQIKPERLALLNDADWGKTCFKVAPSVRLLKSFFAIDQLWTLRNSGVNPATLDFSQREQFVMVSREAGTISLEKIEGAEYLILERLQAGDDLISAFEAVDSLFPEQDISTLVMSWFNQWVSRGIICDLVSKSERSEK